MSIIKAYIYDTYIYAHTYVYSNICARMLRARMRKQMSPFSSYNYLLLLVYKHVLSKLELLLAGLKLLLWDWREGTLTVTNRGPWECPCGPKQRGLPSACQLSPSDRLHWNCTKSWLGSTQQIFRIYSQSYICLPALVSW